MIDVAQPVRRTAESRGPAGRAWLAALPGLVEDLCRAWSVRLGELLPGGKCAFVARVQGIDGTAAVLKVALPEAGFAQQTTAIAAAAGRGYVRLFQADPVRHALLLEPLGPPLSAAGLPIERMMDLQAATLLQAWRVGWPLELTERTEPTGSPGVAAAPTPGPVVAEALLGLMNELWPMLGEPCSPRLIALARSFAERRAEQFDPANCVVCHGDPHADNALAVPAPRPGAESGYVFVDPNTALGEPAYDLGITMRGWTERVVSAESPTALTRAWSARLAGATDQDEQAVWEWALIERVTSGLHLLRHGHPAEGRAFLASAERLV